MKTDSQILKMKLSCSAIFVFVPMFLAGCVMPEEKTMSTPSVQPGIQCPQTFESTITKTLSCNYLLFLPRDYGKKQQKWPLILFLHGAGERGNDLSKVKIYGPPKFAEENKDFPFIVVAPQCPADGWWPNETEILINLLDEVVSHYDVDKEKVYLTGLSMGGYGTWSLACEYPDNFAAVAPVCGGGMPYLCDRLKNVPVWAFHGAKDDIVPLRESEEMVEAVNKAGGNAKLTIYPDVGHGAWPGAYDGCELYDWFLQHRKTKKTGDK